MSRYLMLVFVVLGLVLGSQLYAPAIALADGSSGSPVAQARLVELQVNGQATIGNVRVAVFNVREDSMRDGAGNSVRALTAAIRVFVREDASKNLQLRGPVGTSFVAEGLRFEVLAIDPAGVKLSVR